MKVMVKENNAIGRIDYLNRQGNAVDGKSYRNVKEFTDAVNEELECGVSLRVTYIDDNGAVVSKNLMNDYDCLPKEALCHASGSFAKVFEQSMEHLSKTFRIYDEPTVVKL